MTTLGGRVTAGGPPDLLTVEEAAVVLRIGRTVAYRLARRYLDTDGADGIPAIQVGRQHRVPRRLLEELTGGPITWPLPSSTSPPTLGVAPPSPARRSRPAASSTQRALPFT